MDIKQISKILTDGLIKGYAGSSDIADVKRNTFHGKMSHVEFGTDIVYHDEWFVPNYLGGGQEIVKNENEMFTRLYGGGTPSPEVLSKIGISINDVGKYLTTKIVELSDKTRLFENCNPEPDGDWQYSYNILLKDPNIDVVVAVESITYKGLRVHLHPFILAPLK